MNSSISEGVLLSRLLEGFIGGPVFKNVGEMSTAKNYHPVSLLSVVSKVFEKLGNNRTIDHLEKWGLFSDFWYGFRSSQSTADLLTFHKLKSYGILGQIFVLISSFLSNRQLRVVLDGKSSHKNIQLMLEFLKALFLVLHFS